ncbi:MAG TPA: lipase [Beijerinckiaceae bacterium]|nr:lipase [Beijerinckiaceae bacterium]
MAGRVVRAVRCLLPLVLVAGCVQLHPDQKGGEAIVRIGDFDSRDKGPIRVGDIAGYYVPYALLAVWAYGSGENDRGERWAKLMAMNDRQGQPLKPRINSWMQQWTWIHKGFAEDVLPCSNKRIEEGRCHTPLGGIGVHTFVRKDCGEVVVAFRGTDFTEVNDWITNFHWFTRLLPIYDQYEQVQDFAPEIVEIMRQQCPRQKSLRLTAVGHSLGGGLAQQMAYASAEIQRVYAYDPSMVTGYYDVDSAARQKLNHLEIDRAYEHGEVLAYFRYLMRQFYPPSACNPQIRNVRFDFLNGSIVDQHSIGDLAGHLVEAAGSKDQWERRRGKYRLPVGSDADPGMCRGTGAGAAPR